MRNDAGQLQPADLSAIRLLGRRWSYPLSAQYAHRYTDTRLALVGDAAHGIHPIAGQGLNLGFADAAALADLLIAAHDAGEDLGAPGLLRRYQAARRPANMAMFAATDTPWAPWNVVRSDDKKRARLNVISHLLSQIPYEEIDRETPELPKRQKPKGYVEPDYPYRYVPEHAWS